MAKAPSPEILVLDVARLRALDPTQDTRAALRKYLSHKSNIVVAKSAEVIADLRLTDLAPEMETAFNRFFDADDKGCLAKTALATALNHLSAGSAETFLRGIHHIQMEASFGPPVDAAGPLRATSALALASIGSPTPRPELSDLLADPLPTCRSAAARALAHAGHEAAILPLRLKLLAGDPDPEVLEECLTALVALATRKAVPFLDRLLARTTDDSFRGAILIALGTTRDHAALAILLHRFDRDITPGARKQLLPAIALTRLPNAIEFLLDLLATAHRTLAADALTALTPYRHDQTVLSGIGKVLAERDESELQSLFHDLYLR